jgi:hypothetical protein
MSESVGLTYLCHWHCLLLLLHLINPELALHTAKATWLFQIHKMTGGDTLKCFNISLNKIGLSYSSYSSSKKFLIQDITRYKLYKGFENNCAQTCDQKPHNFHAISTCEALKCSGPVSQAHFKSDLIEGTTVFLLYRADYGRLLTIHQNSELISLVKITGQKYITKSPPAPSNTNTSAPNSLRSVHIPTVYFPVWRLQLCSGQEHRLIIFHTRLE